MIIAPYTDAYKSQVGPLVNSIQQEYGVPITLADQPDLQNITNVYQKDKGNFWLALDGDTVIGTIALIDSGRATGIIRKMFIRKDWRGADKGVSKALLETLMAWAKNHGVNDLYLGTLDYLPAASRFYEKNGFTQVEIDALPPHIAAARMKVDNKHYHRELAA